MSDVKKLDTELYAAVHGRPRKGDFKQIWDKIKSNPDILMEAVQITKNRLEDEDIVVGLTIADVMLVDYDSVDKSAYNELIKNIYTNKDIARLVLKGAANGGYSFLLMSLWNDNLKLTEEQKAFAVEEAMNKIGTTLWKKRKEEFAKKLDEMGVTDDEASLVKLKGYAPIPIGIRSGSEYLNYVFSSLSEEQAHGVGEYDIRYYILKNPNWSIEEKQKLIMDFWYYDDTYYEFLERWEWGIVNDSANQENDEQPIFEKIYLYDYTYDMLLNDFYKDKQTADRIWREIKFCEQMCKLRPKKWQLEDAPKQKVNSYSDSKPQ